MTHHRITSGYALEDTFGYCRAVKAGNTVYVSGTTARNEDLDLDAVGQAHAIFAIIKGALEKAGSGFPDVVRTTIYLADMKDAEAVGRVHGEYFGAIKPALTMIARWRSYPP